MRKARKPTSSAPKSSDLWPVHIRCDENDVPIGDFNEIDPEDVTGQKFGTAPPAVFRNKDEYLKLIEVRLCDKSKAFIVGNIEEIASKHDNIGIHLKLVKRYEEGLAELVRIAELSKAASQAADIKAFHATKLAEYKKKKEEYHARIKASDDHYYGVQKKLEANAKRAKTREMNAALREVASEEAAEEAKEAAKKKARPASKKDTATAAERLRALHKIGKDAHEAEVLAEYKKKKNGHHSSDSE